MCVCVSVPLHDLSWCLYIGGRSGWSCVLTPTAESPPVCVSLLHVCYKCVCVVAGCKVLINDKQMSRRVCGLFRGRWGVTFNECKCNDFDSWAFICVDKKSTFSLDERWIHKDSITQYSGNCTVYLTHLCVIMGWINPLRGLKDLVFQLKRLH